MSNYDYRQEAVTIDQDWVSNPRWHGVQRPYSAEDVIRLRGSVKREHTVARMGADRLWELINRRHSPRFRPDKDFVNAMGAVTGGQAVQQVKAGIQAIYVSGWQVAADNNTSNTMYPDQSLYAVDSVPTLVQRINNAFERADQIQWHKGSRPGDADYVDYQAPIVADAEAGFGGVLNAYELMRHMIRSGAAGVHFEDQLASAKKCGHMGGKVLVPTREAVQKLVSARLAADVEGVPTIVLARTDANAAELITSDCDPADAPFITGERSSEGFYRSRAGIEQAIHRGLAYAPFADMLWCETATPSLEEARRFAQAIHREYPGKLLAYNCSPSFNWRRNLDETTIARFQTELSTMGYTFQFITLAGIHNMWNAMFDLAHAYARQDMSAYVALQQKEFADAERGYTFVSHQQEVGTGYFDDVATVIQGGESSVTALTGSTEEQQFNTAG